MNRYKDKSEQKASEQQSCCDSDLFDCAKKCADCGCDIKNTALLTGLIYAGVLYPELNKQDEEKAISYIR